MPPCSAWQSVCRCVLGRLVAALEPATEDLLAAVKSKLKLSQELRLVEQAVVRLLKDIRTDVPTALSLKSVKAQRAVRARWDRASS